MSKGSRRFVGLMTAWNTAVRTLRLYGSNGSLRAWGVLLRHVGRRLLGRPVPRFLSLAPTLRCQCRCVHCYSSAPDRAHEQELTTDELKGLIAQAKRLGAIEVMFSAGEPLLRTDIVELVRHAHGLGLLARINTNGLLLTRERVAELRAAGISQVGVSIDDPDPEVHDRLRGVPGAFAKAVEGLRLLREYRIPGQIQTYAARRLIPEGLRRIIELGRQIGVFAVYFFFPIAAGRWNEAFDEVLTEAERSQVRALQDWSFVHMELPTPGSLCCVFTRNVLYVSPQGEVTPCPFVPYILGNVREHSLAELWRVHGAGLSFQYRGECPLNAPEPREALRRHVDAVARAVSAAERAE